MALSTLEIDLQGLHCFVNFTETETEGYVKRYSNWDGNMGINLEITGIADRNEEMLLLNKFFFRLSIRALIAKI